MVPREPVEPATITGSAGGARFHSAASASTAPPVPRLDVGGGVGLEVARDDPDEGEAARPVRRMDAEIERRQPGRRHALALHLVHQVGQAVREVVECRPGCEVRLPVEQRRDEAGQLEPAPERRHGGRNRHRRRQIGHELHPRQQKRPPRRQKVEQAALRPARVDEERHPRERFGRLAGRAAEKPADELAREVDTGRQREDAGMGGAFKHRRPRATGSRPARSRPDGPHRTSLRDG